MAYGDGKANYNTGGTEDRTGLALSSFLQSFASSYNKAKDIEMEHHFNKKLAETKRTADKVDAEGLKYLNYNKYREGDIPSVNMPQSEIDVINTANSGRTLTNWKGEQQSIPTLEPTGQRPAMAIKSDIGDYSYQTPPSVTTKKAMPIDYSPTSDEYAAATGIVAVEPRDKAIKDSNPRDALKDFYARRDAFRKDDDTDGIVQKSIQITNRLTNVDQIDDMIDALANNDATKFGSLVSSYGVDTTDESIAAYGGILPWLGATFKITKGKDKTYAFTDAQRSALIEDLGMTRRIIEGEKGRWIDKKKKGALGQTEAKAPATVAPVVKRSAEMEAAIKGAMAKGYSEVEAEAWAKSKGIK